MKEQHRRSVVNRLRTARGHLDAVLRMVEEDAYCPDVMKQLSAVQGQLERASRIVLRNLLVLTAASAPERSSGLSSPTTPNLSAQLALTDGQSQKLEWLIANAEWRLELRPPTGAADSEATIETAATLLGAGVRRGALNSLLATP